MLGYLRSPIPKTFSQLDEIILQLCIFFRIGYMLAPLHEETLGAYNEKARFQKYDMQMRSFFHCEYYLHISFVSPFRPYAIILLLLPFNQLAVMEQIHLFWFLY